MPYYLSVSYLNKLCDIHRQVNSYAANYLLLFDPFVEFICKGKYFSSKYNTIPCVLTLEIP